MRLDFYFTYWILLWFILFIILNKYIIIYPPFYTMLVSFFVNFLLLTYTYVLIKKYSIKILITEVLVFLILKLIPLTILYVYYYKNVSLINEFKILIPLSLIFIIWKHLINSINIYDEFNSFIKNGIPKNGPLANIIYKNYEYLINIKF